MPVGIVQATSTVPGFAAAFSGDKLTHGAFDGLGREWQILRSGIAVKPYPSCALTHSAIDALIELRAKHHLAAEQIDDVEVGVHHVVPEVLRHPAPTNALERKFSMPYCAAAALGRGRVGIDDFQDGPVQDAAVAALMPRVRMVVDPSGFTTPAGGGSAWLPARGSTGS